MSPLLQNKTPFALLNGKMPDYKGLRVFGCLAFCSTSSKGCNKFQPRARPCVFLGYPAGYKAYKLLVWKPTKAWVSRGVGKRLIRKTAVNTQSPQCSRGTLA
ncbi:unnamed protein product [Microthlaspi erraticum]|uniref:Retroviral polymerase SH3-like domain-containing protein n=1 Tax=Microthlaspi erraticum TaxID=1685480 RepID=A0A6D2I7M6_9BRAS|nr:unnamed protein product [Microthlaspi erraticum]